MTWSVFDGLRNDLRYAFRTLRRDAGFTTFAILIVGLGIGASTTVFSVANAILLRPLPFRDPQQLAWITNYDSAGLSGQTTQVNHLLDLRAQNQSFSDLAAYFAFYGVGDNLLSGQGEPERLSGVPVSENFFQVLGVEPQIGRLFNAEECKWHGPKAVMLGNGLWTRRFGADPGIAGRTLTLNNEPYTVVGVLPASFDFATVFSPGSHFDLYFPFPLSPETNRWGNTMAIIGRLKPGVSVAKAGAEVRILASQFSKAHPERNDFEGHVVSLSEHVSGRLRLALTVLECAVGMVMLIVCANLSNLLLARTASRHKEIAMRAALGASRRRLVAQMLTEGIALSCCGAALGVVLAILGTRLLTRLDAVSIPMLHSVRTDPAALGFTLLASLVTGMLFGLAPAIHVPAIALHDVLKDAGRGSTGRARAWLRSALVVSEVAFACVLLVGAGLLVRSFLQVLDVNLGFRPERAAAMRVDPDAKMAAKDMPAYFAEVVRRARAVPGVEAAGLSDALPLGRNRSWGAGAKGQVYAPGHYPNAFVRIVGDGYIRAMGIPLRDGRDLEERDGPTGEAVMMINETMARTLFPGESAIGKVFPRLCGPERRVVGVVGDVRHLALEQGSGMEMYLPIRQCSDFSSVDLVVRTKMDPGALAPAIRATLRPIAPNLPGSDFRTIQALVDKAVSPRRFVVLLLGGFAAFALILASLGIYAVVSYSVSQRTQEIGIRMALGAPAGRLQAGMVGRTLGLASIGMLVGAAASLALARQFGGLLYGVTSRDPFTFAAALIVLTLVATIAGYFPARRASHIDPSIALRAS